MSKAPLKYQVVRGWFKGRLHLIYGDRWYRRMMRAPRCVLPRS